MENLLYLSGLLGQRHPLGERRRDVGAGFELRRMGPVAKPADPCGLWCDGAARAEARPRLYGTRAPFALWLGQHERPPVRSGVGTVPLPRPLRADAVLPSLDSKGGDYHNFPRLLDADIVKNGTLYGRSGNTDMYVAPGNILLKGKVHEGVYTIGINNQTGIIFHRCFYETKDFSKQFHFNY